MSPAILALTLLIVPGVHAADTPPPAPPAPTAAPAPLLREVTVKAAPRPNPKDLPSGIAVQAGDRLLCTLRLAVDERGLPVTATPLTCAPSLANAGRKVAMRYRFNPRIVNEHASRATYDLVLEFTPGVGAVPAEEPPPAEPPPTEPPATEPPPLPAPAEDRW